MSNNDLPCNKCGGQHHPVDRCEPIECAVRRLDNLKEQLKHQDVYILNLEGQVKEWKNKYKDLDRSIIAEGRDTSGTIWEHADRVQKENKALREIEVKCFNFEKQNEALNLSIGILNKRLMTAMELLRRVQDCDDGIEWNIETDEFLKQQ